MAIDKGTAKPTNMALVKPIKNIKMMVTKINPIMMVLFKSAKVVLVNSDWSPVILTVKSFGNFSAFSSPKMSFISALASKRF